MSPQASFRTRCPHCSKVLSVSAKLGGKTVACPNPACGKSVTLRAPAETLSVPAAPTEAIDPAAQPVANPECPTGIVNDQPPPAGAPSTSAETKPADALRHVVRDRLQKLLQPLTEYWAGLQRAGNPKLLADYIASKEGNAANIYKFMGASIALTASVESVLPSESVIKVTPLDKVNNLLMMLIWVLGGLLTASVTYKPLRWLGGQGRFRATLIAAVYVTALYYPMFSLLEGLFKFITNKPMPNVNYLTLVPFCQIVAKIHNLSMSRTMVAVVGASVAVAVLLLPLMIAAENHLRNDAPAIEMAIRDGMKSKLDVVIKSFSLKKQGNRGYAGTATAQNGDVYDITTSADGGEWQAIPRYRDKGINPLPKPKPQAISPPATKAEGPDGVLPVGADGNPLNFDFETGTLKDWTAEGQAFVGQPIKGHSVHRRRKDMKSQHQGHYWIGTYERLGDRPQGTLTSVPFKVTHRWASFLIGGGAGSATCVELVRNDTGAVFSRTSGSDAENMRRITVDLHLVYGEEIFIRLVDRHSGGWGHINFDDFRFHARDGD